jgi:hypothetical protein
MASVELSRRVGKVVAYPPLCEMSDTQRREFHEALVDADTFEMSRRPRSTPLNARDRTGACV